MTTTAPGAFGPKFPAETEVFAIDWAQALRPGEQLGTGAGDSVWAATPAGLALGATGRDGAVTTVEVSGGDPGKTYRISNTVRTSQGRPMQRVVTLFVADPGAV